MSAEETAAPAPAAPGRSAANPLAGVRETILAHPRELLADPEIVQALLHAQAVDGEPKRNVVDLRGALLDRLEARLGRLEETHRTVVSAAYENLAGAQAIHRAALAVLEPTTFSGVLSALEYEVPTILGVDALRLALETEAPGEDEPGPLAALRPGFVADYLAGNAVSAVEDAPDRQIVLRAAGPEAETVFGPDGASLGSEALVRLEFGGDALPGMLAFGARDPERFTPDQAGDLLEFFGGVVSRAVRRWVAG